MQFWLSMTLLFPEFSDFILVFRKPLACAFTNFRCYNDRNNIRLKERSKAVMVEINFCRITKSIAYMHIERISYFLKLNQYDSNDINLLMANMNIEQHE